MALIFEGLTECKLCRKIIKSGDKTIGFPAFIVNENDPLYRFNDAGFHQACIMKSPLGRRALMLLNEWSQKTGPGKRKCVVCQKEILDPDNYFSTEYLAAGCEFNFIHLHKSCINQWRDREKFLQLLQYKLDLHEWKGNYFDMLIKILKA